MIFDQMMSRPQQFQQFAGGQAHHQRRADPVGLHERSFNPGFGHTGGIVPPHMQTGGYAQQFPAATLPQLPPQMPPQQWGGMHTGGQQMPQPYGNPRQMPQGYPSLWAMMGRGYGMGGRY